jgi:GTP cyclohydrolase I
MSVGFAATTGGEDQLRLRVVGGAIDREAAARAVFDLLLAMGQDPTSAELARTPERVATALATSLTPTPFAMTTFANDGNYDDLVLVRDVSFQSLCACHMLPFRGTAHIAYVPEDRIVGLSKVVRVVDNLSRALQTQSRLTTEVADALQAVLDPRGVGVVMKATHLCMAARSAEPSGATTVTTALRGILHDDPTNRDAFIRLTSPSAGARNREVG